MIASIAGSTVYVDLCDSIKNQILFTIPISGIPPISGVTRGVPKEAQPLISINVDQDYPYDVIVAFVDVKSWSETKIDQIQSFKFNKKIKKFKAV